MRTTATLIGPLLQGFFVEHLLQHKRASPQTISSYRDTFRLLLQHAHKKLKTEPAAIKIDAWDAPLILSFLDSLESERHNSIRSRNIRLAAIRSFFRWLTLGHPELIAMATRILAIPVKRTDRRLIHSLTREEIDALLAAPDQSHWQGRRDAALLLTLYNTGARVSEITALHREHVILGGSSTVVHLIGKGRKHRDIPLWPRTATVLKAWFREQSSADTSFAFPSARGQRLSRNGVDYILKRAAACANCPSLKAKRIHPHAIRHTTGSHLLQSGVDISVIALWLGHESVQTTHVYVEADLAAKQRALGKLEPAGNSPRRYKPQDQVLAFLSTL
jgi:site-specific recombinase XerD